MTDMTMTRQTPWHIWAVGVLSLLWNSFGAFNFTMTVTRGEAFLRESGMSQAMVDYYHALPAWSYGPWALGVWGGVVASILLLMRKGLAVTMFALSLAGAVFSQVYGLFINKAPATEPGMMSYLPYFIVVIAALLTWYAWTMRGRGSRLGPG